MNLNFNRTIHYVKRLDVPSHAVNFYDLYKKPSMSKICAYESIKSTAEHIFDDDPCVLRCTGNIFSFTVYVISKYCILKITADNVYICNF